MAYIATKATYIGEEEVKDENGKPAIDDNGKPVKRIKTDVDDVIFTEGEVIVLIEKITEGKHFDLSIEDEGSTYFAPTQIKIGDGFHSFKELNWIQTVDNYRVQKAFVSSIETYRSKVDEVYKAFTDEVNDKIKAQNKQISDFVNIDSRNFLRELVNNDYFKITSSGGLIGFTNSLPSRHIDKNGIGIGSENQITKNNNTCSMIIGNKNTSIGKHNFIFGLNNHIQGDFNTLVGEGNALITIGSNSEHQYCFMNGQANNIVRNYSYAGGYNNYIGGYSIVHGRECNKTHASNCGDYTACFGQNCCTYSNWTFACGSYCESNSPCAFTCGYGNKAKGERSFSCGSNNTSNGSCSFTCGKGNSTDSIDGAFACGKYNISENKFFSIGKGDINKPYNIFDIDTKGKSTFYRDLEVKGKCTIEDLYIKLPTIGQQEQQLIGYIDSSLHVLDLKINDLQSQINNLLTRVSELEGIHNEI